MSQTDNRLLGADFVRASACAIVLFHHLAQRVDFRSELGGNALLQVFNSVGGFGVGMFFVLSGFLLARPFWQALDAGDPLPSLRTYALRRAARIVPGFWLALTVTFIFSFTVFGAVADGWLWLRYGAGLLLVSDWHWTTLFPVEINGPLWSIGFEVTSYLLLPLGFWALFVVSRARIRGWPARVLWLVVIAAALGAHWLFYNHVHVDPLRKGWNYGLQGGAKTWMPWFNPFSFFAMFATGALAGGVQVSLARFRNVLLDFVALAALVAAAAIVWQDGIEGGGEFYGWLQVPYEFPVFHLLVGLVLAVTPSSCRSWTRAGQSDGQLFGADLVRGLCVALSGTRSGTQILGAGDRPWLDERSDQVPRHQRGDHRHHHGHRHAVVSLDGGADHRLGAAA